MNVVEPHPHKGNNNISYKFMFVTMVDPSKGVLEIEEILTVVSVDK